MTNNLSTSTIAIFDLDGTLTWNDTLLPFLARYLTAAPSRLLRLWRFPAVLFAYLRSGGQRGVLKGRLIQMVLAADAHPAIDAWASEFVAGMQKHRMFRPDALIVLNEHRRAGHRLVLMSASPDLYVLKIGQLFGFEETICTVLSWQDGRLDGTLRGANCLGEEKLRQLRLLRARFPQARFIAYGNSAGDLVHMAHVDQATLVNGGRSARAQAVRSGIAVGDWQ